MILDPERLYNSESAYFETPKSVFIQFFKSIKSRKSITAKLKAEIAEKRQKKQKMRFWQDFFRKMCQFLTKMSKNWRPLVTSMTGTVTFNLLTLCILFTWCVIFEKFFS